MGRPRKYADTSERNAAFRETVRRLGIAVNPTLFDTLEKIAAHFGVSKNEVVNSLIRSALTQSDVFKTGLYHYKK